MSLIKEKF